MRPLRTAKTSLADSTQKPQVRPQRDPRARHFTSRHDFGQESHLLAVDRKFTFLQCQAYENIRDRALKGLVKMPVNIVQPLLNFHVFSLADKGKKGNSVSFTVHFKTLQDSSALESLEHFILQVQKISCPMTLTDPVHRTDLMVPTTIPVPELQEQLWTPVMSVVAKLVTSLWPNTESQSGAS